MASKLTVNSNKFANVAAPADTGDVGVEVNLSL